MAKLGSADFRQFKKFAEKVEKSLTGAEKDAFMRSCAKELAARLLAKVIKRTPVGQYPHRVGGTLRRGWTGETQGSAAAYANSLNISKIGSDYVIEIVNPVEYASYVEYGHRTVNHKGWVEGKFMLTISANEIQQAAPKILEAKLLKKLGEAFS